MADTQLRIDAIANVKDLVNGMNEAQDSVKQTEKALTDLQKTMRNMELMPAMQGVVTNFKNAIAEIKDNDPTKMAEAWKTAFASLKNITGADVVKNAWQSLENATTPEQIMNAMQNIGAEFTRKAKIVSDAERESQRAMKSTVAQANAEAREYEKYQRQMASEANRTAREKARAARQAEMEARRAAKEASEATQEAGKTAQKSNGLFKNFYSSLIRIAKLRMLRGIIRMLTQAVREGTENIYQYSVAMGAMDASHFKTTMDGLASSFLYLKNSIGSVVAPLLSSLLPAIQTVISWVSAALNVLAQFFAVLNGQSTYTRAKQTATEWKAVGGAIGGATAAANEYKNTIMSFDEIHALNDVSDGGGGGGGGGAGAPNYADMFEEAELATSGIAGAFNRLATAVKPILGGIWKFTKNTIETIFDGFALACDAAVAVFSGDAEAIQRVIDEMGVFVSKHPVLQHIYQGMIDANRFIRNKIDDIKMWILEAVEWFINLPLVRAALEAIGLDVDDLTENLEDQRLVIQKHKDDTTRSMRGWELWSQGVNTATANMILDVNAASLAGYRAFANVKTAADLAKKGIDDTTSAVENAEKMRPTFANVIRGFDNTAGSAWNAYSNAVAFGNTIDKLRLLNGTEVHFSMSGVIHGGGGFTFADGGFVPHFDGGGINSADLFLANENGNAELVGRIGNRTAVANQQQMVDVLTNGVLHALSNAQGGQTSNLEVNVMMDRQVLARAVDKGNRALSRRYNVNLA